MTNSKAKEIIETNNKRTFNKTEEEWKKQLSPEAYQVLRKKGTERPFTNNQYYNHKENGLYYCAGCGNPLFSSEKKFDSGTGWPSYYDVLSEESVEVEKDKSHGMERTEVLCAKCGGHLGHLFNDGPQPTGQRYCINSVSLGFKKDEKGISKGADDYASNT